MTITAKFVVQDVGPGPRPINVLAVSDGADLNSNTEGKIQSIELRLLLDEDETWITEGFQFQLTGHFSQPTPTKELTDE